MRALQTLGFIGLALVVSCGRPPDPEEVAKNFIERYRIVANDVNQLEQALKIATPEKLVAGDDSTTRKMAEALKACAFKVIPPPEQRRGKYEYGVIADGPNCPAKMSMMTAIETVQEKDVASMYGAQHIDYDIQSAEFGRYTSLGSVKLNLVVKGTSQALEKGFLQIQEFSGEGSLISADLGAIGLVVAGGGTVKTDENYHSDGVIEMIIKIQSNEGSLTLKNVIRYEGSVATSKYYVDEQEISPTEYKALVPLSTSLDKLIDVARRVVSH